VSVCLDSWAVIAWLDGQEPATAWVESLIGARPVISWINLAEVYYRVERLANRQQADEAIADVRLRLAPDLPTASRMVEAARLKARHAIAFADCFAVATAAAHRLTLLTGDPEILDLEGLPCQLEDLRGPSIEP
jgi:predicted nucleic acid-binding protein